GGGETLDGLGPDDRENVLLETRDDRARILLAPEVLALLPPLARDELEGRGTRCLLRLASLAGVDALGHLLANLETPAACGLEGDFRVGPHGQQLLAAADVVPHAPPAGA